jgi:hypothetical protein
MPTDSTSLAPYQFSQEYPTIEDTAIFLNGKLAKANDDITYLRSQLVDAHLTIKDLVEKNISLEHDLEVFTHVNPPKYVINGRRIKMKRDK